MENLVNIGTIVGTHHLTGSVKINSNNIDLAKELNGLQIKIRRDLLPEKTEDDFYLKDLLGVEVFEKGEKIGEVIDIMETAAHDILVIQDIKNHKEILVPQIDVFVKKIDFDNNKMDVELIDGMREETNEN